MRIKHKTKFVIDIFMFLSGLASIVTGMVLLILPSGPGTRGGFASVSQSAIDLTTRSGLRLLHDWSSLILVALIIFHLILNRRIILCYFRNTFRTAG